MQFVIIQLLERDLNKTFADNMQSRIWDYFEDQMMPIVYCYDKPPAAAEEEENIFAKLADCLIKGCEKLSKSEV